MKKIILSLIAIMAVTSVASADMNEYQNYNQIAENAKRLQYSTQYVDVHDTSTSVAKHFGEVTPSQSTTHYNDSVAVHYDTSRNNS